MAWLGYTKTARYTLPAWSSMNMFIDGIYVDGAFFEENIPIKGARLGIWVTPPKILRYRYITFSVRAFASGEVYSVIKSLQWGLGDNAEKTIYHEFTNDFYGMGLNTIMVKAGIDLMTNILSPYDVKYVLAVEY